GGSSKIAHLSGATPARPTASRIDCPRSWVKSIRTSCSDARFVPEAEPFGSQSERSSRQATTRETHCLAIVCPPRLRVSDSDAHANRSVRFAQHPRLPELPSHACPVCVATSALFSPSASSFHCWTFSVAHWIT